MPVINPAELWQESGRWDEIGDEMFRFKDRKGADMALAMTHEECVTWLAAREIRSLQAAAAALVPHPDQGARRGAAQERRAAHARVHHEGLVQPRRRHGRACRRATRKHIDAYDRIFARCGLESMMVAERPGHDGRRHRPRVHGAQRGRGGRGRVLPRVRLRGQRRAGRGRRDARWGRRGSASERRDARPPRSREVHTPNMRTIDEVAAFLASTGARLHEVAGRRDRGRGRPCRDGARARRPRAA